MRNAPDFRKIDPREIKIAVALVSLIITVLSLLRRSSTVKREGDVLACAFSHTIRWTKLAGRGSMASVHLRGRRPCGAWQQRASARRFGRTTKNTGRLRPLPKGNALRSVLAAGICLALSTPSVMAMRIPKPWNQEPACVMVRDPEWPFVYSKYRTQEVRALVYMTFFFQKSYTPGSVFLAGGGEATPVKARRA